TVVDDQRRDGPRHVLLVAERTHPGAAALRGAGKIVAIEKSDMFAPAGDFPDAHLGVIDRYVLAWVEIQVEQAVRRVERSRDHLVELEVWFDFRFVEIVARLAQLFGVIAPVPRRQLEIAALF